MIQYALKCPAGHQFESWFKSAAAFDALQTAGHLTCAVCGGADVSKAIMAPRVSSGDTSEPVSAIASEKPQADVALTKLRQHIEKTADYVGTQFAKEARDMHLGSAPERPIYGEATREDARKLVEDGVPVAPLPFVPRRKTN